MCLSDIKDETGGEMDNHLFEIYGVIFCDFPVIKKNEDLSGFRVGI